MSRLNASEDMSGSNSDNKPAPGGPKRTVDELMQDHVDFLATCLKECMLTNSKLLRVSHKSIHHHLLQRTLTRHRSTQKSPAPAPSSQTTQPA